MRVHPRMLHLLLFVDVGGSVLQGGHLLDGDMLVGYKVVD